LGQWVLLALRRSLWFCCGFWLSRTTSRLAALSLGSSSAAVGNAIDRFALWLGGGFRAVSHHTASFNFNWYVFNLADVAIVRRDRAVVRDLIGRCAKAP